MSKPKDIPYDFSGYATRNDIECSDGRTIRHGAFASQDGETVALCYGHRHDSMGDVIGHAVLENRKDGVYAYCKLNNTDSGELAKELIHSGDLKALSIWANGLKQIGKDVVHGTIRELSLVLSGANPGAYIDTIIAHDAYHEEEAIIATGYIDNPDEGVLEHSGSEEKKKEDGEEMPDNDKTVGEVIATLNDEQKAAVGYLIQQLRSEKKETPDEEEKEMKHNVFEANATENNEQLMHDALETILADGKRYGSLKESFLAHADEYGITNIEYLFPEARTLQDEPMFINNQPENWVQVVMSGVHKTPFSRIKSVFADITEDEARAKGYIKGKKKKEEVFSLLKRTTTPTTIYKKQKLDRDDIVDITDFNVVSWIKGEMRMKLNEELARAILFGDGRLSSSDDHINPQNIRPAYNDDSLYTITVEVDPASGEALAHAIIDSTVVALDDYQGSGNLIAFMPQTYITQARLLEDGIGHRLYKTNADIADAMGVNKICPVPKNIVPDDVYALVLDLSDYNVGADKGGEINMFDDFDIDYNQQKYLMETRCSGALVKPYSTIVLKKKAASV